MSQAPRQTATYLLRTSITCGSSFSFDMAGNFSRLACSSSAAAESMASRSRDTSSSAALSSTSSSASFLRFFGREPFFGFRIASICISNLILLANTHNRLVSIRCRLWKLKFAELTFFRWQLAQILLNYLRSFPFLLSRPSTYCAILLSPGLSPRLLRPFLLNVVISRLSR